MTGATNRGMTMEQIDQLEAGVVLEWTGDTETYEYRGCRHAVAVAGAEWEEVEIVEVTERGWNNGKRYAIIKLNTSDDPPPVSVYAYEGNGDYRIAAKEAASERVSDG